MAPRGSPGRPRPGHEREVQERFGTLERADRFYRDQMLDHLNPRMRELISRQEMLFVSTADAHGECDATFRAGQPGFVLVLDERTLAWPEYRGNGVMASVANIVANPHAGLLFIDFVESLIGLHVNGAAAICSDASMRAAHPQVPDVADRGRQPQQWVVVRVEEAYIHCAKHIPRLRRVPHERVWGTDDVRRKGGDFFEVKGGRGPRQG